MATLTRLASTLTARYFPSQTLTDAFYMDGRLCGKRETRSADITMDKDAKGFFFSIFTHPAIQGFEPGDMPPFEPQLRALCNDVKVGNKDIDSLIEKFLSTAVGVAGNMKLSDTETRNPYFSGVIVKDAEAFAVTIGSGLAFLYRDDTLFPLTDAGIPMEPIDAYGNRVGDFQYYCSSKTANALWSNFFTLTPDDCIILCNKAVYDSLGQRELLRILTDAEDQCDAAGTIITQASARMPNTPMQFSISFVEGVTKQEKRGLFGFKKKDKDPEEEEMIQSTVDGGLVGKSAEASASAGFVSFATDTAAAAAGTAAAAGAAGAAGAAAAQGAGGVMFGDAAAAAASAAATVPEAPKVDFPETQETAEEISAEEVMKNIFGEMKASSAQDAETAKAAADLASQPAPEAVISAESSPFVASVEPEAPAAAPAPAAEEPVKMETVSQTAFVPDEDENSPTKPVEDLNSLFFAKGSDSILAKALQDQQDKLDATETKPEELKEEPQEPVVTAEPLKAPEVVNKAEEIVFAPGTIAGEPEAEAAAPAMTEPFDPYGKASSEELLDTPPLVFGDDANAPKPEQAPSEEVSDIPLPDFKLEEEKPEIKEEDKLNVDFPKEPEPAAAPAEEAPAEAQPVSEAEQPFVLPFGNAVETINDVPASDDIPDMPVYDGGNFDTPENAINSEELAGTQAPDAYAYGDYNNQTISEQEQTPPYQPYGTEAFPQQDQQIYGAYNTQGGASMDENNGFVDFGNGDNGQNQFVDPESSYTPLQPEEGAAEFTSYQEQAYTPEPEQASASSSSGLDEEWFNNILGVDDSAPYTGQEGAADAYGYAASEGGADGIPSAQQQAQYTNPGQSSYRPSGEGPSNAGRPGAPKTASGAGRGGNGGGRKFKMTRNGYIFFGFCGVFLVCVIIMIVLIAKGCSKANVEETEPSVTSPLASEVEVTLPTAAPTTPAADAPIGYFVFSDYIGYRTWWDVFHYVYGIDIEDSTDARIAMILTYQYNNLDPATYKPNSGDKIVLPPAGIFSGEITTETAAPDATAADAAAGADTGETTAADAVEGEITVN